MESNKNFRKSKLLETIEKINTMNSKVRECSHMAFEAVDEDNSDSLDKPELGKILKSVAKNMKINPPTDNDIDAILAELDADSS